MAEASSGGGNSALAFIVGGLVVVVLAIAAFMFMGRGITERKSVDVDIHTPNISAPKVPDVPAPAPARPG